MEYINKLPRISLDSKEGYPQTSPIEFIEEDIIYIKFDGLPFDLREYILSSEGFDRAYLKQFPTECRCGNSYFYPEEKLYTILENY